MQAFGYKTTKKRDYTFLRGDRKYGIVSVISLEAIR